MYPNAKYYGTPRHLRNIKDVPWAGTSDSEEVRSMWPGELSLEVTPCLAYENPAEDNHAAAVFVFHHGSRTLHLDDTLTYFNQVPWLLSLLGTKPDEMKFRFDLKKQLDKCGTPDAMKVFRDWYSDKVLAWDIENASFAHNGVIEGGAKQKFEKCLGFLK